MATFKYRESTSAPWQELPVINGINTVTNTIGFSTETHDVIIINKSPGDELGICTWLDWKNYITNLDDIELLIIFCSTKSYIYVKGMMPDRNADGCFPMILDSYASSKHNIIDYTDDNVNHYNIKFTDSGVSLNVNGWNSTKNTATIYCVLKKGAA